jgi:hypothetical protein
MADAIRRSYEPRRKTLPNRHPRRGVAGAPFPAMPRSLPGNFVRAALVLALAGCVPSSRDGGSRFDEAALIASKPRGTNALVIHLLGEGSGSIAADSVPFQCTSGDPGTRVCWAYPAAGGPPLRVLPAPDPGSTFGGWLAGNCAAAVGSTCLVTADQDQILAAGFARSGLASASALPPRNLTVNVLGAGSGTVTATGAALACTTRAADSLLGGWGSACAGSSGNDCTLTMAADSTATVTFSRGGAAPLPPPSTLSVIPATATLDACRGLSFAAQVPAGTDPALRWSVLEPGGGTVSNGTYTAPSAAGTYHVVATSTSNPSAQAVATVTVTPEKVLSVAVVPGSAQVSAGGGLAFRATVTTTCGTFAAN